MKAPLRKFRPTKETGLTLMLHTVAGENRLSYASPHARACLGRSCSRSTNLTGREVRLRSRNPPRDHPDKLSRVFSRHRYATAGFTLLELVVVMGIMSGFLLMLVQLLTSGVKIFQEGERGQKLSDHRAAASRAVVEVIDSMVGPSHQSVGFSVPAARLRLDWTSLGLGEFSKLEGIESQVLRATVALDRADYRSLLQRPLDLANQPTMPENGRAQMLLFPWPVGDDGVFLELRQAIFAKRELDVMGIADLTGEDMPEGWVAVKTRVVVKNLLHLEVSLWSQLTRDWHLEPDAGGPEYVWDSARAGSLLAGRSVRRRFRLDLGIYSLHDPRDDVFPRWCRITMVLDDVNHPVSQAFLDEAMTVLSDVAILDRGEAIVGDGPGMVKIGSEWVGYRELQGRRLIGLRRALRGTKARDHGSGTRLRRGIELIVDRPLHHGRDAQDG